MKEQIDNLRHLQELDIRIVKLDKEIEKIPIEIESITQELTAVENEYKLAHEKIDTANKERRKKERELEGKEELLSKYKTQLLSVKTNKEYDAMQHEIANKKEEISHLEEEIIILIDKTDADTELLKQQQHELKISQEEAQKKQKIKEQHLTTLKEERERVLVEKKTLLPAIEPRLLDDYSKLYQSRGGIAVVEARDNACLGCNIRLMSQLFQEIMIGDKMIRCPNCSRILYYISNSETNENQ
ncbi:MAG: zinc ribbon domain-containing protein [bacterium]